MQQSSCLDNKFIIVTIQNKLTVDRVIFCYLWTPFRCNPSLKQIFSQKIDLKIIKKTTTTFLYEFIFLFRSRNDHETLNT